MLENQISNWNYEDQQLDAVLEKTSLGLLGELRIQHLVAERGETG